MVHKKYLITSATENIYVPAICFVSFSFTNIVSLLITASSILSYLFFTALLYIQSTAKFRIEFFSLFNFKYGFS